MPTPPNFLRMSLDELRRWPALRICLSEPLVAHVRGTKSETMRILTVFLTPDYGVTIRQMTPVVERLQRIRDRWVWEGWLVGIEVDGRVPKTAKEKADDEKRNRGRH